MNIRPALAAVLLCTSSATAMRATTTVPLNLHSGPVLTSPVLAVLPKGTRVNVGVCSRYCPVIYQGKRGYIARQYLQTRPGNAYTNWVPARPVSLPLIRSLPGVPAGAVARCKDGTFSYLKSLTCARHGGVSRWY